MSETTTKISQVLQMGSVCALGYDFNTQLGSLQICISLHFLVGPSLKVSQRLELSSSHVFCEYTLNLEHECVLLDSQKYVGDFQSFCFPKHLTLTFPPRLSALSASCLNCYPLGQEAVAHTFAFI